MSIAEMALTLWAINKGFYEDVPVSKALVFETDFLGYVRTQHTDVLDQINQQGVMSDENEQVLTEAINTFKASRNYSA